MEFSFCSLVFPQGLDFGCWGSKHKRVDLRWRCSNYNYYYFLYYCFPQKECLKNTLSGCLKQLVSNSFDKKKFHKSGPGPAIRRPVDHI